MQINKKGQIVNAPIYKINGEQRRALKKKQSSIKQAIKMYWHFVDINEVYGIASPKDELDKDLEELKVELAEIEAALLEPHI